MKGSHRLGATLTTLAVPWLLAGVACSEERACDRPACGDAVAGSDLRLPARVRRLTAAEYESAALGVLGLERSGSLQLIADARQEGFTVNAAQIVSSLVATQYQRVAEGLAAQAVQKRLGPLEACVKESGEASCVRGFTEELAERAFRGPVEERTVNALLEVYRQGTDFAQGIELVTRAILQSPSFLYLSEVGEPLEAGAKLQILSPHEVASAMSFLITGGSPDEALRRAANAGQLQTADEREAQARRLFGKSSTRFQFRRLFKEWLGIDTLESIHKDAEQFPEFSRLRPLMIEETDRFIDDVLIHEGATVSAFLNADYALVNAELAEHYGLDEPDEPWGRVSLRGSGRRGILHHGSFLAAHSHEIESGPVLRGVTILRRLLCVDLAPPPQDPDNPIMLPPPDPNLTGRERLSQYTADERCSGCHSQIDPLGFAFEHFDAIGAYRESEAGRAIDAAGRAVGSAQRFEDSEELAAQLAESSEVKDCFARQLFRFATGQGEGALERAFLSLVEELPEARRDSAFEMLVALVRSELFIERRTQ